MEIEGNAVVAVVIDEADDLFAKGLTFGTDYSYKTGRVLTAEGLEKFRKLGLATEVFTLPGTLPAPIAEAPLSAALAAPPTAPAIDRVRVLRVVEYEGPRALVEEQIGKSLHGTKHGLRGVDKRGVRITAVSLNEFPEVLEKAREDDRGTFGEDALYEVDRPGRLTQDQLTAAEEATKP